MKAARVNLRGFVKHFVVALALLLLATVPASAQGDVSKIVTLEGQFVCSECWFEADRNITAYGTAADLQCAQDCAVKGVPHAVAVKEGSNFKLYLIDSDRFKRTSDEWLGYLGKWVKVSGHLQIKKDRHYIVVDELALIPEPAESAQSPNVVGSEAELILMDLFGVEQKLSAYRGRIVILNFWATWCVPCRKEMPDLAAIQNEYAALGVQVIGSAADTLADRSKVLQFVKETRINFPVWLQATTEDMKRLGLGPALPGTAIIGRDGRIIWVKRGVVTQADLRKQVDGLLASDAKPLKVASQGRSNIEASMVPS